MNTPDTDTDENGSLIGECLTAAEMIRRKQKETSNVASETQKSGRQRLRASTSNIASKSTTESVETTIEKFENIDEEIRRLEEELQALDEDDDLDSSDEEERVVMSSNNGVISLSESKNDTIEHLPAFCLPAVPRNSKHANPMECKHNGVSHTANFGSKRKRPNESTDSVLVSNGFKSAVQEIIRNYQPRSAEKLPFYCRYCATQYTNAGDFSQHQSLPQHKQAVILDQKASYCKLCRKQLTSPAQLREHLQSRPHKERLNFMQSKSIRKPTPRQTKE